MRSLPTFALLVLLSLSAASTSAEALLPQRFGNWTQESCAAKPPASLLAGEAGDEQGASTCTYKLADRTVMVWAEKFRDPSGAYEVYTSLLKVGMNATTIGGASAVDAERLLTLVGNYVIEVSPPKNISDADLLLLLKLIKAKAAEAPLPPVRAFLPNEGLVQGTQRYALGPAAFKDALDALGQSKFSVLTDEVGFKSGTEAMLASYATRGGKPQTLLLLDYPTPQLAEQHLRHIQPVLSASPELASTTAERKASLLSLVLSPNSERAATQLRDEINYETQVTWNEPSHTLTDPPWVLVLKNIFLGTFAFCGLALVLGLAFGGVRLVTKRLLPGKVFDRPQDMEVLQLGLSGKRIDPRDFY